MIDESKKTEIIDEYRKTLLQLEKENLAQLQPKSDSTMATFLKDEFEKVVKKHENN